MAMPKPDFVLNDRGAICLVTPCTDAARTWLQHYTSTEPAQWFGGSYRIDKLTIKEFAEAARKAGLAVVEQ